MQILNRKVRQDYQILESFEAGIELFGPEVKSIRQGQVRLEGAHVQVGVGPHGPEARLIGMHAAPYVPAGTASIDPTRSRRLLLHRAQILSLWEETRSKSLTLVPLRLYAKRGWIKVEVGLVRGKKKWEKKETLKRRDIEREIRREAR